MPPPPPPPPELVEYSMAQLANPGEENQDALLYQIHDLFLDYLKHLITEEQQVGTLYTYYKAINTMGIWCATNNLHEDRFLYKLIV